MHVSVCVCICGAHYSVITHALRKAREAVYLQ